MEGQEMQLTIDSKERMEQVLRVVGSFYGVELAVLTEAAQPASPIARSSRRQSQSPAGRRRAAAPAARGGRGRAGRSATPDVKAVRAWARTNGYQVSDRGRIPNTVVAAYQNGVGTAR